MYIYAYYSYGMLIYVFIGSEKKRIPFYILRLHVISYTIAVILIISLVSQTNNVSVFFFIILQMNTATKRLQELGPTGIDMLLSIYLFTHIKRYENGYLYQIVFV